MDTKSQIAMWIENAVRDGLDTPNETIMKIANENAGSINQESLKRLVEGFNTKAFLTRMERGENMEQNFPIASYRVVSASVLKNNLEKVAHTTVISINKTQRDYYAEENYKEGTLPIEKGGIVKKAHYVKPVQKRDNTDFLNYCNLKVEQYLTKFAEHKKYRVDFVEELRYLVPKSFILKAAKLDTGNKSIPDNLNDDHREFVETELIIQKLAQLHKVSNKQKFRKELEKEVDKIDTAAIQKTLATMSDQQKIDALNREKAKDKRNEQVGSVLSDLSNIGYDADNKRYSLSKLLPPVGALPDMPYQQQDVTKGIESLLLGYPYTLLNRNDSFVKNRKAVLDNAERDTEDLLNQIKTKSNFENLVNYDPMLQGADQENLLSIYRDATSIAPEMMKRKEVARTILREANSIGLGGMNPELVSTLARAEQSLGLLHGKYPMMMNQTFGDKR